MRKFLFASVVTVALIASPIGASAHTSASKLPVSAASGSFKFVFNSMDCSKSVLGDKYINSQADGTYCVFKVTVKNVAKKADYVPATDITAVDAKGNEFDHDSGMAMYLKGTFMLDKVSPGNQKQGFLVYDVPKGTKLTKLVISGGLFGDDVTVKL